MRRLVLSVLAACVGLVAGWASTSLTRPADAQSGGCWGSICQTKTGVVITVPVNAPFISLSTVRGAIQFPGDLTIACTTAPVIGPGAGGLTLRARRGAVPGTMNLVAISGNGQTEVVLQPNIPGGSC